MLGCTFNEYKDRFEENLAKYLEAYEDNTPLSFLKDQIESYKLFLSELNKISNELRKYGETNANKKFLRNRFLNGLIKLDIKTYEDIQIENKSLDSRESWNSFVWLIDPQKKDEDRPDWFEARIDYNKLKNYIISTEKILKFITDKCLEYQSEPSEYETKLPKIDSPLLESGIENPRDPVLQKIEMFLMPYSHLLLKEDYELLTNSLFHYFEEGNFPKLDRKIIFKRVNKKKIGWALNEIYTFCKSEKLSHEYLLFAHENINLYKKNKLDKVKLEETNIYKYFKSKPKK